MSTISLKSNPAVNTTFQTLLKSLLVAAGYVIAILVSGTITRLTGLSLPQSSGLLKTYIWTFVGGLVIGVFLGPIAAALFASRTRHLFVWGSIIFFNIVSIAIEGSIFVPEQIANFLPGIFVQQILTSIATAWLITKLFAPKDAGVSNPVHRNPLSWIWRFVVSALSYPIFYFVFGAINYILVTKPYYETHAGGLAAPSPNVVFFAESIRAPLIVLSVLPFLLSIRMEKKQLAIFTGLILFSIGGLVPLIMRLDTLPLFLLAASAVEIFFQNFLTGVVAASLLGHSD